LAEPPTPETRTTVVVYWAGRGTDIETVQLRVAAEAEVAVNATGVRVRTAAMATVSARRTGAPRAVDEFDLQVCGLSDVGPTPPP